MKRVVLAVDHALVRHGVRVLLEEESEFDVVGETGDGVEAVRLVERLRPDVAVFDLMTDSMNEQQAIRHVIKKSPKTGVVILSTHSDEACVVGALQSGAKAYVLKGSATTELLHAIRLVAFGHHYLCPTLLERAIETYVQQTKSSALDPFDTLTAREREVAQLTAQGYANSEIATKLYLSRRTVEVHIAHAMRKLGLQNQTQVIHYVVQNET